MHKWGLRQRPPVAPSIRVPASADLGVKRGVPIAPDGQKSIDPFGRQAALGKIAGFPRYSFCQQCFQGWISRRPRFRRPGPPLSVVIFGPPVLPMAARGGAAFDFM